VVEAGVVVIASAQRGDETRVLGLKGGVAHVRPEGRRGAGVGQPLSGDGVGRVEQPVGQAGVAFVDDHHAEAEGLAELVGGLDGRVDHVKVDLAADGLEARQCQRKYEVPATG